MPEPTKQDFFQIGGMQVDVNPFQHNASDVDLALNFYSKHYQSKKVRFGCAKFLDNPDNSPIRNLFFYQFPGTGGVGLIRISDKKAYVTTSQEGSWGTPISGLNFTEDVRLGMSVISGKTNYVALSNKTDGLFTYDGGNVIQWSGTYTPKASYLATAFSRLFGDVKQLSLAESEVGFDYPYVTFTGAGNITATNGSATVTGTATGFTQQLAPGAQLYLSNGTIVNFEVSNWYTIQSIESDTSLTLTQNYEGGTYSNPFQFTYTFSANDPFYYNPSSSSPSQGGLDPVDSGNNGAIIWLDVVANCVNIYKQKGIYRYDGNNLINLNFGGTVIPNSITTSDYYKMDYFLSFNALWQNDGQTVAPTGFGINTIIQDTFVNLGIPNPLSYSFDYLSFFWLDNIFYQPREGVSPLIFTNSMLVKDERFNEWYIWKVGHKITAFGSYVDTNNVRHMVTGDDQGNTYVWGEQYANDAGIPIDYDLRMCYQYQDAPTGTKVPQPQFGISADPSNEAKIAVARDFEDKFYDIGTAKGFFSKYSRLGAVFPAYNNIAWRVFGSTTTTRPEVYGATIKYDEEERYSDTTTTRTART